MPVFTLKVGQGSTSVEDQRDFVFALANATKITSNAEALALCQRYQFLPRTVAMGHKTYLAAIQDVARVLRPYVVQLSRWDRDGRIGDPFSDDEYAEIDRRADARLGIRTFGEGRAAERHSVHRIEMDAKPWYALRQVALAARRRKLRERFSCRHCGGPLPPRHSAVCGSDECRKADQRERKARLQAIRRR